MSVQQQWLNVKTFSTTGCQSNSLESYQSVAVGICTQNDTSSSYINSVTALSNGNYSITESSYTGTQCSGTPLNVVTFTVRPGCQNSDTSYSVEYYSITNSIPPLPAGLLYRYIVFL
jgi:hypothetical protein